MEVGMYSLLGLPLAWEKSCGRTHKWSFQSIDPNRTWATWEVHHGYAAPRAWRDGSRDDPQDAQGASMTSLLVSCLACFGKRGALKQPWKSWLHLGSPNYFISSYYQTHIIWSYILYYYLGSRNCKKAKTLWAHLYIPVQIGFLDVTLRIRCLSCWNGVLPADIIGGAGWGYDFFALTHHWCNLMMWFVLYIFFQLLCGWSWCLTDALQLVLSFTPWDYVCPRS